MITRQNGESGSCHQLLRHSSWGTSSPPVPSPCSQRGKGNSKPWPLADQASSEKTMPSCQDHSMRLAWLWVRIPQHSLAFKNHGPCHVRGILISTRRGSQSAALGVSCVHNVTLACSSRNLVGIVYTELSKAKYKQVENLDCSWDCLTAKLEAAFTLESLCVKGREPTESSVKSPPAHTIRLREKRVPWTTNSGRLEDNDCQKHLSRALCSVWFWKCNRPPEDLLCLV